MTLPDLASIGRAFALPGSFVGGARFGGGHIHDTFAVTWERDGIPRRYVHQRLNRRVFPDLAGLMQNFERVLGHIHAGLAAAGGADRRRRALTLVPTPSGSPAFLDGAGGLWRTCHLIEGAVSRNTVRDETEAFEAARAFGEFARLLADLPPDRLVEVIPGFHDTPARLAALEAAAVADPIGRAGAVRREIEFARARAADAAIVTDRLRSGEIPRRVVHNDTKVNNVLFDRDSGDALAVLDLDTVMPGSLLYDFGDLVRTCVSPAAEDERDLSRVRVRESVFRALAEGYLAGAAGLVTRAERALLPFAGRLLALETGTRFLTDHLLGDRYFRTERPDHNLHRCRTQFRLVEALEAAECEGRLADIACR